MLNALTLAEMTCVLYCISGKVVKKWFEVTKSQDTSTLGKKYLIVDKIIISEYLRYIYLKNETRQSGMSYLFSALMVRGMDLEPLDHVTGWL